MNKNKNFEIFFFGFFWGGRNDLEARHPENVPLFSPHHSDGGGGAQQWKEEKKGPSVPTELRGTVCRSGEGGSVPSILLLSFVGKRDESAKGRGEERLEGEEEGGGALDGCQTRVSRHPGKKDQGGRKKEKRKHLVFQEKGLFPC